MEEINILKMNGDDDDDDACNNDYYDNDDFKLPVYYLLIFHRV